MASEAEHEARRRAEAIANSALEEGHANEQATLHEKLDDLARSVSLGGPVQCRILKIFEYILSLHVTSKA